MSKKWTKEQIETAKKYLAKGNCTGVRCRSCPMYANSCILGNFETLAYTISHHEHDADEPKEQSNPLNDPKMEWINLPTNMSVHDYWRYQFAGMAMQGLLADSKYNANAYETAEDSIKFADALLKQLEEKK